MFRNLARAIRAALARLKTMVWKTVEIGGKLISVLVPAPNSSPAVDDIAPDLPDPAAIAAAMPSTGDEVKLAAGSLAQGQPISPSARLTPLQRRWLAAMDRPMLCKILCADDVAVARAAHGIEPVRGVIWCSPTAIDEYETATERDAVKPTPRPNLRQALAQAGYAVH